MDTAADSKAEAPGPRPLLASLRQRALQKVYTPRPAPVSFPLGAKGRNLYPFVAKTIGEAKRLTYLEFGVFQGSSIRRMSELFTHADSRFVGFDSFEGLPEPWSDKQTGAFSTQGKTPVTEDARVSFVKGYFQNSLPGFLSTHTHEQPTLVHFDADLYSSTLFLLSSLWHRLPEYFFIYDEFIPDELIALHDFMQAYPVELEFLACTSPNGDGSRPTQVFGHMRNVPLTL